MPCHAWSSLKSPWWASIEKGNWFYQEASILWLGKKPLALVAINSGKSANWSFQTQCTSRRKQETWIWARDFDERNSACFKQRGSKVTAEPNQSHH